jgi:hypothetical protein
MSKSAWRATKAGTSNGKDRTNGKYGTGNERLVLLEELLMSGFCIDKVIKV